MFTFSNLLKRGANYLFMVLIARSISISDMGIYSAYTNIIGVFLLLTNFGFSEYLLVNSENAKRRKENNTNFLQLSICIFSIMLVSIFVLPIDNIKLAVLILIKIYLETNLYNILLAYYQVIDKIRIMTIANIISGVLVIVISGLSYFYDQDITIYLIGINITYILILIVHLGYVKFSFIPLKKTILFVKERFADFKYYGISMVTVPIYMMAPTVIGSFLLPSNVLAQYQIAFSIANILLLVSISLLQVDYVQFLKNSNDIKQLTAKLKLTALKIFSVNLLFLFFFLFFGKEILLLVYKKEEYAQAFYPLLLLLFGNTIFMFASISAVIMVILKLQKEKVKYHLEFIFVSIFFGFGLTYFYGIYGLISSYIILYLYSSVRYIKRYADIYKSKIIK